MFQLYNFFIFIVLGLIIALIFDLFRILRKKFNTNNIITYIEDVLFWIISGFLIISAVFKFNNGELRLYLFLGILIGIVMYMLLFTKFINLIFLKILTPVQIIIDFFLSLFKKNYNFINKTIKKSKNKSKKTIQKNKYNL